LRAHWRIFFSCGFRDLLRLAGSRRSLQSGGLKSENATQHVKVSGRMLKVKIL
jgi:hypothetical protein